MLTVWHGTRIAALPGTAISYRCGTKAAKALQLRKSAVRLANLSALNQGCFSTGDRRTDSPARECVAALDAWLARWNEGGQSELHKLARFHGDEKRRAEVGSQFLMEHELPLATMSRLMRNVLPDYEASLAWLDKHFPEVRIRC